MLGCVRFQAAVVFGALAVAAGAVRVEGQVGPAGAEREAWMAPASGVGENHLRAMQMMEQGSYSRAVDLFLTELAESPTNQRAQVALALCYEKVGRYHMAAAAWRQALVLPLDERTMAFARERLAQCRVLAGWDPVGERGALVEEPLPALTPGQIEALNEVRLGDYSNSSDHFVVRSRNPLLSQLVTQHAEQALRRVLGKCLPGWRYTHHIEIVIYRDSEELGVLAGGSRDGGGQVDLRLEGAGPSVRRILLAQLDGQGRFNRALLRRDLPRLVARLLIDEYFGERPCPPWLREGLGLYAQWEQDPDLRESVLERVRSGGYIPLGKLVNETVSPAGGAGAALFRAESLSLARFILGRLGEDEMAAFLRHLKSGQTTLGALERAVYAPQSRENLAKLEDNWLSHVLAEGVQEGSDSRSTRQAGPAASGGAGAAEQARPTALDQWRVVR